jgi:hypothetical protein
MTALNMLQFGGYMLRPAGGNLLNRRMADLDLARAWTAADPDHAGRIEPGFWLQQGIGVDSYLASDRSGPLLFLKIVKHCFTETEWHAELHVQFAPGERERTRCALMKGMEWLIPILERSGAREIYFATRNQTLLRFAVKRLGFKEGLDAPKGEQRLYRRLGEAKAGTAKAEGV